MDSCATGTGAPSRLTGSDLPAVLAATGLSAAELPGFCAIIVVVLDGCCDQARGMALHFWRRCRSQPLWADEVRRFVVRTGPWALGCAAPTPDDVLYIEEALELSEDGPARTAWLGALEQARLATAQRASVTAAPDAMASVTAAGDG